MSGIVIEGGAGTNVSPGTVTTTVGDKVWLEVNPSSTFGEGGLKVPFCSRGILHRKGVDYDSDSPHLVAPGCEIPGVEDDLTPRQHGDSQLQGERKLHIHVPGTGSSPTCHHVGYEFMSTVRRKGWASVSLSYEWANFADAEKNRICVEAGNPVCQTMLAQYHHDVSFGGSHEPLTSTHMSGSIVVRIAALLVYMLNTRPRDEGWASFLSDESSSLLADAANSDRELTVEDITTCVRWSHIILTGHSQGAGHVAFIAQQLEVGRVVLFSGPQEGYCDSSVQSADKESTLDDLSEDSQHWLEAVPWKARRVFAMMHKEEEGTADLIRYCWRKVPALEQNEEDNLIILRDERDAFSLEEVQRYYHKGYRCIETALPPNMSIQVPDARPNHNSLTTDLKTPVSVPLTQLGGFESCGVEKHFTDSTVSALPVYSVWVWPYLLGCLDIDN